MSKQAWICYACLASSGRANSRCKLHPQRRKHQSINLTYSCSIAWANINANQTTPRERPCNCLGPCGARKRSLTQNNDCYCQGKDCRGFLPSLPKIVKEPYLFLHHGDVSFNPTIYDYLKHDRTPFYCSVPCPGAIILSCCSHLHT